MDTAKFTHKAKGWLLVAFLLTLPLGQLPRLVTDSVIAPPFSFHLLDLIALINLGLVILDIRQFPVWAKKGKWLVIFSIFTLTIAVDSHPTTALITPSLYLLRLAAYISIAYSAYITSKNDPRVKKIYLLSLIAGGIVGSIMGYLQYLFLPDLRPLAHLGWDDHYYRLTSVFMDPAFAGIYLAITAILISELILSKTVKLYWTAILALVLGALFLTYSRSTYLSMVISFGVLGLLHDKKKLILGFSLLFLVIIPILPKRPSDGTKLLRTHSIVGKIENYQDSVGLFAGAPLFGIGYNTTCLYKPSSTVISNNACAGLDNSLLFVLVTTGIVGLFFYGDFLISLYKSTSDDVFGKAFLGAGTAVLVHSIFTNTLFYFSIMGVLAVLIGVSRVSVNNQR